MLVQRAEIRFPGVSDDARYLQAALRSADCAVSMFWSTGVVTDWGLQARYVDYIARQDRSQITLLLAGHGYVATPAGIATLRAGDVVELDQRRHDDEGYAGSPCHVLVVEWKEGSVFGAEWRDTPRCSRLSPTDVARFCRLTDRVWTTPGDAWLRDLARHLGAVGLATVPDVRSVRPMPLKAARLYEALGPAQEAVWRQPSITELAERLRVSERHLRRGIDELHAEYGLSTTGWRSFVNDVRFQRAHQLLAMPGVPLRRVAELSGFRSQVALSHAFAARGGTPGRVARELRARWG